MGFTLEIILSGLIAFAPDCDRNEMTVFLPSVPVADDSPHRHYPRLEFNCETLRGLSDKCEEWDLSWLDDELHVYDISATHLVVLPGGTPANMDDLKMADEVETCQWNKTLGQGEKDINWVPPMKCVLGKTAKLKPLVDDLFREPLGDQLSKVVAARARFTEGEIRSSIVPEGVWQFRTSNSYATSAQEVAHEVIYWIYVDSDYVTLELWPLSTTGKPVELHVSPPKGDSVKVFLTNEPNPCEYCKKEKPSTVAHFDRYYALSGLMGDLPRPQKNGAKSGCKDWLAYEANRCEEAVGTKAKEPDRSAKNGDSEGDSDPDPYGGGRYPIICMGAQFSGPELPLTEIGVIDGTGDQRSSASGDDD